jgi:hypothetical protein
MKVERVVPNLLATEPSRLRPLAMRWRDGAPTPSS